MPTVCSVQVRTTAPDGSDKRWLGQSGHLSAVSYSHAMPGGSDQFSATLQASPRMRDQALRAGRSVQVFAGPKPVWDGQLNEPSPGQDGWQITAHGAGTFGSQFNATTASWTSDWSGGHAVKQAISDAIGRGLRWIGTDTSLDPLPSGAWLGQQPDNGSLKIDELLNLVCSRGGLTWRAACAPGGNIVTVFPLPSAVTRLLVATGPVARTIAKLVNGIALRYQASGTPTYGTAWVFSTALSAMYGEAEDYIDLSNAGTDSGGTQAASVGSKVLARYQQATWGGSFTVQPGQYLNAYGTPVSLATEQAGEVARVLLADYGGQISAGLPVTFPVGGYSYDEESGTAQVTPFGSYKTDWQALVARFTQFTHRKDDPFGLKTGGRP